MTKKKAASEAVSETTTLSVITRDLVDHREYIHKLYTRAFWVGGAIITIVLGIFLWFTGNRLSTDFITFLLDDRIITRIETLSEIAEENAIKNVTQTAEDAAIGAVNNFISQKLNDEVSRLVQTRLDEITDTSVGEIITSAVLPQHSVIAFAQEKCPLGWERFNDAEGRFIIGSSNSSNDFSEDKEHRYLIPYSFTGGSASHLLTVNEMPRHQHSTVIGIDSKLAAFGTLPDSQVYTIEDTNATKVWKEAAYTDLTGQNQPHNNMPPYIALTYCKKL